MLPLLIVTFVVAVAYITTVVATAVAVAVLFAFSIAGRPLFVVLGTVSLPTVRRTTAIVLFAAVFAIFAALFTGGTVFFIGR